MHLLILLTAIMCNCAKAKTPNPILEPPSSDDESSHQYHAPYVQLDADINQDVHRDKKYIPENGILLHPARTSDLQEISEANPLFAALLISATLGITQKAPGFNHPQYPPVNPYVALLLSHYGRYVPAYGRPQGIYGYAAANNLHNNKPFGSYKIYEDP